MKTPDEFKNDVYAKSKVYANKKKKTKRVVSSCLAVVFCFGIVFATLKNIPEHDTENEESKTYGYSKEDKAIDGYEKKAAESQSETRTLVPEGTVKEMSGDIFDGKTDEEPENHTFQAFNLQSFLDFVNNDGNTHCFGNEASPLWSDYAENTEFIEWVYGKTLIPVPVTASCFKVEYSCIGEKEYCFYISTSDEKLTAQVIIEEILPDQTADLSEIVRHYMAESGKAYYEADGEHISGECRFGEYVLYDRHPWKSEFQGEETTSICPPILFFRYGDYLVRVTDRRNPEAEKWDIHFLDCFDLEMYEIQRNRQDK